MKKSPKRSRRTRIAALVGAFALVGGAAAGQSVLRERSAEERENDPDQPKFLERAMGDEGEYLRKREAWSHEIQGLPYRVAGDPRANAVGVQQVAQARERELARTGGNPAVQFSVGSAWTQLGPAPIPNGQTFAPTST